MDETTKTKTAERIAEQIAEATPEEQDAIEAMLWGYLAGRRKTA